MLQRSAGNSETTTKMELPTKTCVIDIRILNKTETKSLDEINTGQECEQEILTFDRLVEKLHYCRGKKLY